MQSFGEKVKGILTELGWGQTLLAKRIGKSQPTLSRILKGEIELTRMIAEKIAAALSLSLEELVKDTDKAPVLQSPQVMQNALEEAREALLEEQAESERCLIECKSLQKENERITAELRERPRKEELTELKELLAKVEEQKDDLQARLQDEEKKKQAEEKAKQAALRAKDESNQREANLLQERLQLRTKLQELERANARLSSDRDQFTKRLKDTYKELGETNKELDEANALIDRYAQATDKIKRESEQAKREGRASNALNVLLGAGLLGVALAANSSSSKPKNRKR